jgi:hypothetical protein
MKTPQEQDNEEYRISPLLEVMAKMITFIIQGLYQSVQWLWRTFLWGFSQLILMWKQFAIAGFVGAVLFATFFHFSEPNYYSELILDPRFAAEEQLLNDLNYLQSLVKERKVDDLAEVLKITTEQANSIKKIEFTTTYLQTEKLRFFDAFVSTIDTTVLNAISLKKLIENTELEQAYSRYHVTIFSNDPTIFQLLEDPIVNLSVRNSPVTKQRDQWVENLQARKFMLDGELSELDSLKLAVKESMVAHANNATQGGSNIVMGGQSAAGNEYIVGLESVFDRSDEYNAEITKIDMLLASESDIIEIQAHFSPRGIRSSPMFPKSFFIGFLYGIALLFLFRILRWFYIKGLDNK